MHKITWEWCYKKKGRFEEAISCHQRAITLNPEKADVYFNLGCAQNILQQHLMAIKSYQQAIEKKPDYVSPYIYLARAQRQIKQYSNALQTYQKLIRLKPDCAEAYYGLGVIHSQRNQYSDALKNYKHAIHLKTDYAEAYCNLGSLQYSLEQYPEAIQNLNKAIALNLNLSLAFGYLLYSQRAICLWDQFDQQQEALDRHIQLAERTDPFITLSCFDSPKKQQLCARNYIGYMIKKHQPTSISREVFTEKSKPIRIAYLSADFHAHATSFLMAELFELHDRAEFEIFAFSFGPKSKDIMQQRVTRAFDHFEEVGALTDQEVAQRIAKFGIAIAVDLKGYTKSCRPMILAHRPAPVQVNYLGYPGTMGADFIDYVIADKYVVPTSSLPFFTEKLVYLPDSYQVNDRQRVIPEIVRKASYGLPEDAFVFGCFNNSYKITPTFFEIWMRLLKRIPNSVLWLLEYNPYARDNLSRAAKLQGVSESRLIFSSIKKNTDYLTEYHCIDLFLDTLPVNAHTTASDALWMGVPVLTCSGKSFAARVAGSLLTSVGLTELITNTLKDYEQLAYNLATSPQQLNVIKEHLRQHKKMTPLFDTPRFCGHLEAAYKKMWGLYQSGNPPETFCVKSA